MNQLTAYDAVIRDIQDIIEYHPYLFVINDDKFNDARIALRFLEQMKEIKSTVENSINSAIEFSKLTA